MDTIWNCAFGLDINLQFDKSKEEYFEKCEALFDSAVNKNFIIYFGSESILLCGVAEFSSSTFGFFQVYFHETKYLLLDILMFLSKLASNQTSKTAPFLWLRDKVVEVVENREKEKVRYVC